MKIYVINQNTRYFDGVKEVPDDSVGFPPGTSTVEPILEEGKYAVWNGSGWDLTDLPPPVKAYSIDTQNQYFNGEVFVDSSSIDDVNFTLTPVPYLQPGEYTMWDGSEWYIVNEPPVTETVEGEQPL